MNWTTYCDVTQSTLTEQAIRTPLVFRHGYILQGKTEIVCVVCCDKPSVRPFQLSVISVFSRVAGAWYVVHNNTCITHFEFVEENIVVTHFNAEFHLWNVSLPVVMCVCPYLPIPLGKTVFAIIRPIAVWQILQGLPIARYGHVTLCTPCWEIFVHVCLYRLVGL